MPGLSTTDLVNAINTFTFALQKKSPDRAVCGTNVYSCLLMAACTFRGKTQQEMLDVLGVGSLSFETARLAYMDLEEDMASANNLLTANSLWHRKGLTFARQFEKTQGPGLTLKIGALDEAAINVHVKQKTRGLLTEKITVSPDAALVLVSCLYFKANWMSPFDPEYTFTSKFQRYEHDPVACSMMRASGKYRYSETDDYDAVLYPYAPSGQLLGAHWAAGFVRPKEFSREALDQVFDKTTSDHSSWRQFVKSFRNTDLSLVIPRFETRTKVDLIPALRDMGLAAAFEPSLDLWALEPVEERSISQMSHMMFLRCDEFGTELAAETDLDDDDGLDDDGKEFRLDRPFWFFVFDQVNGTVLYSGFVNDVGGVK